MSYKLVEANGHYAIQWRFLWFKSYLDMEMASKIGSMYWWGCGDSNFMKCWSKDKPFVTDVFARFQS